MTKHQENVLNKIFGKGRLSDATIKVCDTIITVAFPEGRTDKLRITETGMLLGHLKHI